MKKLKVGILGCGKMGRVYARWFSANPHCKVVALYNRSREKAEELAKNFSSAKVFDTWEELIEESDIHIVGICTPSHEHLGQITMALKMGKHILCEKPLANDIHECRRILELCQSAKTKVMVGFQMRFHPAVETVDRLLTKIGKIYHVDFVFGLYRPGPNWRHSILQDGGVLKELASHLIDLMCHWAGEITSVTGINKIIEPEREVEDYSVNLFEFKNGASGFLFSSYLERRSSLIQGNIMGKDGQISFQFSSYDPKDSKVFLLTQKRREILIKIPKEIDEVYPGHLNSFKKEIDYFVDCILNDRQPEISCWEGYRALEVIDASYESTRKVIKVRLPLSRFNQRHIRECFKRFK
ncbi:MAG: Gfo/Idh/MocA family oxidoreductase [Planctomycetes bacterium]|nr:Gfo/Idh/MocA family oxidoreductase [Planctomycetota bacterium]